MDNSSSIIDDTNEYLIYSEGWSKGVNQDRSYNKTISYTSLAGATVTINFSVTERNGTITVYGRVFHVGYSAEGTHSSYSLDGILLSYFNVSASVGLQDDFKVMLYQSPPLSIGNHSLTVTNLQSGTMNLYIDFFRIAPGSVLSSTSIAQAVPTVQGRITAPALSATAIVGFTVVGLILCIIIALVLVSRRPRRRKRPLSDSWVISRFLDGQTSGKHIYGVSRAGIREINTRKTDMQAANSGHSQGLSIVDGTGPAPMPHIPDIKAQAPLGHAHPNLGYEQSLPPTYVTDPIPPSYRS